MKKEQKTSGPAKDVLRATLKQEIQRDGDSRYLHRLHCVLLASEGCDCTDLGKIFDAHPRTVQRWVSSFLEFGIIGLREESKSGRPPKISRLQLEALKTDINRDPRAFGYQTRAWNGKLMVVHLQERYRLSLGVRQCQRLLRQLTHCNLTQNQSA